jgi:hypothetical protein
MKIDLITLTAPENCPSFEICQFNDCPLEKKPNDYRTLPEDKTIWSFHKCRCSKKKRMHIAKSYNMKTLGLTLRELSSMRQSLKLKAQPFSTQEKKTETPTSSVEIGTSESQQTLEVLQ